MVGVLRMPNLLHVDEGCVTSEGTGYKLAQITFGSFLPSGMTTVATGQVLLAGSTPAGLAAGFAAPSGLAVNLVC